MLSMYLPKKLNKLKLFYLRKDIIYTSYTIISTQYPTFLYDTLIIQQANTIFIKPLIKMNIFA